MFTKNWYAALASTLGGNSDDCKARQKSFAGSTPTSAAGSITLKGTIAGVPTLERLVTNTEIKYANTGVIIGSGTTPPTIEDYVLENRISTPTSHTIAFTTYDDGNGIVYEALFTITNTHSEPITISEIGLYGAGGSGNSNAVLMERTVLEAPITIQPGSVGQVTYTIRMNYPTA